MRSKIILILMLLIVYEVQSQDVNNGLYFNISYFGILGTHPGIKFGVQYPLATFNKDLAIFNSHQVLSASNIVMYFHRRNQIGVGFTFEVGYRNRKIGKTNKEVMVGIGYLRTFIPNRIYQFNQDGNFTSKRFLGASHFVKIMSLGLGRNLGSQFDSGFWMIKPTIFHLKPYNSGTTINFALDAGCYFR